MSNPALRPQTGNTSVQARGPATGKPASRRELLPQRGRGRGRHRRAAYPGGEGPSCPAPRRAGSAGLPPLLRGTPLRGPAAPPRAQQPLLGPGPPPRLTSSRRTRRRRPRSTFPAALGPRKGAGRQRTEERKGPAGPGGEGRGRDGTGDMNGSASTPLDKEEHPLQLGESFERRPKASFHTIRCERHPLFFPAGPAAAAPSSPLSPRFTASRPPAACPGGASPSAAHSAPTGERPLLGPLPAKRPRGGEQYLPGAPLSSPRFPPGVPPRLLTC